MGLFKSQTKEKSRAEKHRVLPTLLQSSGEWALSRVPLPHMPVLPQEPNPHLKNVFRTQQSHGRDFPEDGDCFLLHSEPWGYHCQHTMAGMGCSSNHLHSLDSTQQSADELKKAFQYLIPQLGK